MRNIGNHRGLKVLFVLNRPHLAALLLASALLQGCVGVFALASISEVDKKTYLDKIGYYSRPDEVVLENGLSINAVSMNSQAQMGRPEYLICVETQSASLSEGNTTSGLELDLRQIRLHLDSGIEIRPDKYLLTDYRCPPLLASSPNDYEVLTHEQFQENTNGHVKLNSRPGTKWLQTFVMRFNRSPPMPEDSLSLELGTYVNFGKELSIPLIQYRKCHAEKGC